MIMIYLKVMGGFEETF